MCYGCHMMQCDAMHCSVVPLVCVALNEIESENSPDNQCWEIKNDKRRLYVVLRLLVPLSCELHHKHSRQSS